MMDPIDSLARLIATLRRQQTSGSERLGSAGRKDHVTGGSSGKPTIEELEQRIAERLHALDGKDPQRAARIFLEAVLTWEFGDGLLQDSRSSELLKDVESEMRADPNLSARLDILLRSMTQR